MPRKARKTGRGGILDRRRCTPLQISDGDVQLHLQLASADPILAKVACEAANAESRKTAAFKGVKKRSKWTP
jgi:hypothetical protein